jgi:hypothetical protein
MEPYEIKANFMDEKVFSVLVYVKLILLERELLSSALAKLNTEQTSIIGKVQEVFFVVPKSTDRSVFINSEAEFFHSYDKVPIARQSMLIPYDVVYLDRQNIQNIFSSIEFVKYKRKDFRYFTESILRGYIPFGGLQPVQADSEFEV